MRILQSGIELVGNVGWGVVKHSGRCLYGGGQAVLGMVSEDEELIGQGVKNLGKGAMGLTFNLASKFVGGDSEESETADINIDAGYDI